MGINISGRAKLWKNEHEKRDGSKWYDYSVSINRKKQDGTWVNASIKARFGTDVKVPRALENGTYVDIKDGYMTVDSYTDKDGFDVRKPMLLITEAKFDEPDTTGNARDLDSLAEVDDFASAEEDVPF